ncbi:hypothetical protein BR93DRAFT_933574 [Coniochaeta sp. PMI_546]|nr:hypothetical protein BR93DRAFT_933574 [Coniochaeta sp. PMI_546]
MVNPAFSAQHKRLLIELLPFTDSQQLLEWIRSAYVLGAWEEFRDDFLMHIEPHEFEQPDKTTVCQAVNDVLHSRDPKYRIYHPVKTSWTAYDHTVRSSSPSPGTTSSAACGR